MKVEKVSEKAFIKSDKPSVNDLFVAVRNNGHQTPYLIIADLNIFALVNLHSGQKNYIGKSIDELIERYLEKNSGGFDALNPIIGYFFVKGHKADLEIQETFGYKSLKGE